MILAIDPGPDESGYYLGNPMHATEPVVSHGHLGNHDLRYRIEQGTLFAIEQAEIVIEDFEPWNTRTGHHVVQTCKWIGRIFEVCLQFTGVEPTMLKRRAVCQSLVGNGQARKPDIRAFCVDRWGPGEKLAIGTKKQGTGPLYGLRVHEFDALALAVAYAEGLR